MECKSVNEYWSVLYKVMWDAFSTNVLKSSSHSEDRTQDVAIPRYVCAAILRKHKKKRRRVLTEKKN